MAKMVLSRIKRRFQFGEEIHLQAFRDATRPKNLHGNGVS